MSRLLQFRGKSYRERRALMKEGWVLKNVTHFTYAPHLIPNALFAQFDLTKYDGREPPSGATRRGRLAL